MPLTPIKLIDGAGNWHRFWSLRWALLCAALNAAEAAWSAFNGALPALVWASVNGGLMVAIAVSRVIDQNLPPPDKESTP